MSASIKDHDPDCLFCKIVAGKIPSRRVYEDDEFFAFHDIHPWAPVHFLLIPKMHIMMALVPQLALQEGCNPYPDGGYRLVTNTGAEGGQEVRHLHFHVMGGPRPWLRG
jgi:histidine triad (HIT) family protein